ncbi:chromosome partitioning protein [Dactylosporangium sp. NPDC051484]|uniref:MinD/ParA family ATP-binding protein n=1 Tax=Dactylosporangium sp. NPDC051484 TaxID=3154942 RepID=UPI00344D355F
MDGRRGGRSAQPGPEHVGSPWSQPPSSVDPLAWPVRDDSGPESSPQADPADQPGQPGQTGRISQAARPGEPGQLGRSDAPPGLQHGRPVPHVPTGGEPVSSPGGGGIPVSGSGAIPVSGGGGIPVSGGIPVDRPFAGPSPALPAPREPVSGAPLPGPVSGPPHAPPTHPYPVQPPPQGPPPMPPQSQGPPPAFPAPREPVSGPPLPSPVSGPPQAPPAHPYPVQLPPQGSPPQGFPPQGQRPPAQGPFPPTGQAPYPASQPMGAPTVPPLPPMPQEHWHDGSTPTAEEFARRRQARPADPIASRGVRAALSKGTLGLVTLPPGRREMEYRQEVEMVRRNFGGLRQVTVVNPKGGAGKTVAVLLLAMTFGQKRGGYVLAWDNNETQGTLGMRAQQDFHTRTVRDLLHDMGNFRGAQGRVGDLSQYVRAQGEGMFDVLASDESATAGEMLTADAFGEIRDVVSRFYKLIVVDTGNNVRAENWQAAIDATDQLVVTMSARNDSAETASRMLDHLEQHGRQRLVRQAVTVVSMPPSRRHVDVPAITRHFAARTRIVLIVPYERFIDSGEPIHYPGLSTASRDAWLKVAAAVSEGL